MGRLYEEHFARRLMEVPVVGFVESVIAPFLVRFQSAFILL